MRTYKMTISYDGTRYQGWQRQAMTDNTIQHILEWTIGRMVGYRVQWIPRQKECQGKEV